MLTFHDDLNIHHIYEEVLNALKGFVERRDEYERECKRLETISRDSHNPADRTNAANILEEMEKLLPMVKDGSLIVLYQKKISPYLIEYNKLCGSSRIFGMDQCTNIPKRVGIIISFLESIKEFSKIEWSCSYNMEKICPKCFSIMKKCGPIMCCICGYNHVITRTLGIHIEGGRIKAESTYDASKNFRKEFLHLCGAINDMKDEEEEDVRSYLYRASIKEPTRDNIRDGIHATGYNNYHDTNYIFSLITKEPLPPILPYLDMCITRFEQYFRIFHTLEDKEGINITNLHFLIKLFFYQEDIEYSKEWFRNLSDQTEAKHKRNAKKICTILRNQDKDKRWDYPPEWDISTSRGSKETSV